MIRISDITYHTGDLEDNPDRWHSEGFHRMLDNMNAGGFGSGDLGYGFLGTGVYHTTDTEDLVMD
ncbi:MAG: hypothetical protein J5966_04915, partial [Lachnospiraceae bacterium]|nr:hypothetical protein [Lachnospiraceae bacterium]